MRLGRILLASLTALAAYSYTQAAPVVRPADSFPRLLQAVVPLFVAAADSVSATPTATPAGHAWLNLDALAATPFAGSLVLLASFIALDLFERRHQRSLLRC